MTAFIDTQSVHLEPLLDALYVQGWCVLPQLLPDALCLELCREVSNYHSGELQPAGVGRGGDHLLDGRIRRDRIYWLDGSSEVQRNFLAWMEGLRLAVNRRLFLGLWDYECHFARYLPGAFYKTHLDAFAGSLGAQRNRVLSTVLYLNPDWNDADGGELVLYHPDEPATELGRFSPRLGTLAVFLSERFPHEVLPAARPRHSIAGWFRVNGNRADRLDPAR